MSWFSDILDETSFSDKVLLKVAVIKIMIMIMSWVSDISDEDSFSVKVLLKVAVIKETRRLLPNFQITYTIAATVTKIGFIV